jgi:hypothetical protein
VRLSRGGLDGSVPVGRIIGAHVGFLSARSHRCTRPWRRSGLLREDDERGSPFDYGKQRSGGEAASRGGPLCLV